MAFGLLKQYYKSIIVCIIIVWLSLSGSSSMMPGNFLNIPFVDKIGHFMIYMSFSAVLLLDSCKWQENKNFIYFILIIPVIFGAFMETMQLLVTRSRQAELLDLAANILGIDAGLIAARIFKKYFLKYLRTSH